MKAKRKSTESPDAKARREFDDEGAEMHRRVRAIRSAITAIREFAEGAEAHNARLVDAVASFPQRLIETADEILAPIIGKTWREPGDGTTEIQSLALELRGRAYAARDDSDADRRAWASFLAGRAVERINALAAGHVILPCGGLARLKGKPLALFLATGQGVGSHDVAGVVRAVWGEAYCPANATQGGKIRRLTNLLNSKVGERWRLCRRGSTMEWCENPKSYTPV